MDYRSERTLESKCVPDVKFTIARMSFGRRVELTRRVWELASRLECLAAGNDPKEKLEAALAAGEIERVYLNWGLLGIEGLVVDGQAATPELLAAAGPEELTREIIDAIKTESGLATDEAKN